MRQERADVTVPAADVSRLAGLPSSAVADALGRRGAIDPPLIRLAGAGRFAGLARTVDCRGPDPRSLRAGLEACADGDVLVIDARGGAVATALVGELVAAELSRRGVVAVVVVGGYVRDVDVLRSSGIHVYACGVTPVALIGTTPGTADVPLEFDGLTVCTGDVCVGDDDGVVAVAVDLVRSTIAGAEAIVAREREILDMVVAGESLFDLR